MISAELHARAERYRRPSALAQISLCEGAPVMQAHVVALDGEPPTAAVAELGTDGHRFISEAIENWKVGQSINEPVSWGDIIADACNKSAAAGLDAWTVSCIQKCLEFARDIIAKHDIHPDNVLTEHQLDMAALGFQQKENSGRADLVLVIPGVLVIVVDWKLGFLDQGEADEHDQTQAYASAAADTFDAEEVIVWLVQPRAPKEHRLSAAKFDAETLRSNRAWTIAVLNRSRSDNPQLTAGYHQCLYCKAIHRCPERQRFIMDTAEALNVIGKPLDGPGYAELIAASKVAEKFAETGKDLGKAYITAGNDVPGWKLGTPRALRSVANPAEALATLEANGITAQSLALADAITFKAAKLPPEAAALVTITENLSSPPLVPDKSSKRVAA